jgi:hypothetical protein
VDKWLEALQKVATATTASAKPAPIVDTQFSELIKVSDDDDIVVTVTQQLYDSDAGVSDVPDAVTALIAKAQHDKFRIPEIAPPHEDGTFLEKGSDGAVWEYSYKGGTLQKIVLQDPKLGRMEFDEHGNEVTKRQLNFAGIRWPEPSHAGYVCPPVRPDLDLLDAGLEELLGSSAYPEKRQEISADSEKKKAASSEAFNVGGQILAKGEVASRMYKVLEQIRSFCESQEAALLEKSMKALDLAAFGELVEPVLARMRRATELVRSY